MATRYPVGAYLKQITSMLGLSPARILRRVGLSEALLSEGDFSVDIETYFRFWDAMSAEADRPGIEMDLAMAYAHGPFIPPIFAFSCAETLSLGLERLSVFKPIIGPMRMDLTRDDAGLTATLRSSEPNMRLSSSMGLFELLYITECARTFTGTKLTPVSTSLPLPHELDQNCLDYLGKAPQVTGVISLTFSPQDADLPLITRSASLWETLEPGFVEQLDTRLGTMAMSGRVKRALVDALPGGAASVDDIARRLNVSRRSLQRRLSEEGSGFQELLNQTRFEMSERYLKESTLSLPEISNLLGFRETSSFYRAFQNWTGTTPGEYRSSANQVDGPQPG